MPLLPYRVADMFRDIISPTLFYQLLLCAGNLAFLMAGIDSDINLDTLVAVCGLSTVLMPTFFYCNFSENVTTHLLSIGDSFFSYPWYELPVTYQPMLIFPIQRSYKEFRLTGYKIVDCSLRTFSSVGWL